MKKQLLVPLAFCAALSISSCAGDGDTTTTDSTTTTGPTTTTTTTTTRTVRTVSETETYTDLKTGKTFKLRKDSMGNYASFTGDPLEYYYSPVSHDTFYGITGRWVNDALIYDAQNGYTVDETRWAQLNGAPMDNTMEATSPSGAGVEKVKVNANGETKVKYTDGSKVKTNDNETKVKNPDGSKTKTNGDETKVKH